MHIIQEFQVETYEPTMIEAPIIEFLSIEICDKVVYVTATVDSDKKPSPYIVFPVWKVKEVNEPNTVFLGSVQTAVFSLDYYWRKLHI